jgi:hypothetical protein
MERLLLETIHSSRLDYADIFRLSPGGYRGDLDINHHGGQIILSSAISVACLYFADPRQKPAVAAAALGANPVGCWRCGGEMIQ